MKTFTYLLLSFLCAVLSAADKPNILWLTLEDTSPQFIGSYGNKDVKTPTIDKLAAEGVMFTNAFSTGTVCAPSRFTIITGCSTERMGTGNHRSTIKIPDKIKGFPYYLKEAGYYTSNNYKTDYNTGNAKQIIENAWHESSKNAGWHKRSADQPFFSVFNYNTCHQSRTMTNPYAWYEANILKNLPPYLVTNAENIEVPPFYKDSPELRKHLVRVHNSINLTDYEIKQLLDSLKEQGLLDETIIFCYADHGEAMPRGKANAIGLGYRVPFIVWFPDKYKHLSPWELGKPCNEIICFADLAPTMLSLTGLDIPEYMQGRPFLGEKRKVPGQMVFGSRNRIDETPGLARTVTNGEYLYTRVYLPQYPQLRYQKYADVSDIVQLIRSQHANGKLNAQQASIVMPRETEYLYNLKTDHWEMQNLANKKVYTDLKKGFQKAIRQQIIATRDAHFLPEYELDKINKKGLVADFCLGEANYQLNDIVSTVELIGSGAENIEKQIDLLQSSNNIVRYWAAVGLNVQKELPSKHLAMVEKHLSDTYPPVQIEMAAILYKYAKNSQAKTILSEMALHDNPYIALQALQNIQYGRFIDDFSGTLHAVIEKYSQIKKISNAIYHVVSTAEVCLFYNKNQPLYFEGMKKWLPK